MNSFNINNKINNKMKCYNLIECTLFETKNELENEIENTIQN